MGLHASVEFDFPTETPQLGLEIDYSEAINEFCTVFDEAAYAWCPVDTGYLRSTIYSEAVGDLEADCWADAEYAQYQEYGTWCMAAQPYFEPAIAAGIDAAIPYFIEAFEDAMAEEQEILQEMQQEAEEEAAEMESAAAGMGLIGMLMMAIIIGLIRGFLEAISTALDDSQKAARGGGNGFYTIDIT